MEDFSSYFEQQPVSIKHSGFGIASFIISIVVFFLYVGSMMISVIMTRDIAVTPDALDPQNLDMSKYGGFFIVGLIYIGGIIANLTGIVLGIIGVIQKNCKKVFGILGLIFNLLPFLGMVGLFIIGLITMASGISY